MIKLDFDSVVEVGIIKIVIFLKDFYLRDYVNANINERKIYIIFLALSENIISWLISNC